MRVSWQMTTVHNNMPLTIQSYPARAAQNRDVALIFVLSFFPSLIFWSSP